MKWPFECGDKVIRLDDKKHIKQVYVVSKVLNINTVVIITIEDSRKNPINQSPLGIVTTNLRLAEIEELI